ncbi:Chromo (CHRromatin Organization MOdifier) domain [Phytophthora infestans]|uniref:Chromo (CHRromatin Organization MOdifier) domain n=1 Tax=Phytophthora infestans TaxID=4787 RepID=A0A8S9UA97_PHYIN|nr:Chromo (CHRromatin Organization MOdifier) domain [Phytophthora infestans]
MATPDPTPYCVCQQTDGAGIMIECIRGSGGCNGMEELEALDAYVCPLCEKPDDDFTKLTAFNTSLANRQAKRERKRKLQPAKPVKEPWICAACQHPNRDRRTRECALPHTSRHDQEASGQRSKRRRQVPAAGPAATGRSSPSPRNTRSGRDDDSESDEAEFELDTSKEEAKPADDQAAVATMVIEKIMGVRQREVVEPAPTPPADSASANLFANRPAKTTISEYLKWKGFAYMHASWETKQVLLELDPLTNKQKIKRFHEKEQHRLQIPFAADELEYFNPEYLEIHRIIAHRQDTPMSADPNFPDAPEDDGMRYYIKWRILPYTDATWERACDIKDDAALTKYKASIVVPDEEVWKPRPRPSIREYRKLEESPKFGEDQSRINWKD